MNFLSCPHTTASNTSGAHAATMSGRSVPTDTHVPLSELEVLRHAPVEHQALLRMLRILEPRRIAKAVVILLVEHLRVLLGHVEIAAHHRRPLHAHFQLGAARAQASASSPAAATPTHADTLEKNPVRHGRALRLGCAIHGQQRNAHARRRDRQLLQPLIEIVATASSAPPSVNAFIRENTASRSSTSASIALGRRVPDAIGAAPERLPAAPARDSGWSSGTGPASAGQFVRCGTCRPATAHC